MASSGDGKKPHGIVFFGTPHLAALALRELVSASRASPDFEVRAVVSQPPRPSGRNRGGRLAPSPVAAAAAELGIPSSRVLTPDRPGDAGTLATLAALSPDLFVTAAYGNYLPNKVLRLAQHGTLNIHPSLLPAYRGAAPIQRALMDGLTTTGVSLLYSVKEMDAGPVLAQQSFQIPDDIQAPELGEALFKLGTQLLLQALPDVWTGRGPSLARSQSADAATQAPKLSAADAPLDFSRPAATLHGAVRACVPWPGSTATCEIQEHDGRRTPLTLKILRTAVEPGAAPSTTGAVGDHEHNANPAGTISVGVDAVRITCGDGRVLSILELQVPGKKPVTPAAFANGLRGRRLFWVR